MLALLLLALAMPSAAAASTLPARWRAVMTVMGVVVANAAGVGDYTVQFEGAELRVTEERPPRLAVRDAVSLICRVEAHRAARMRIAKELKPFVGSHEFGGSKWHQSPVIAVNELYRLIETLPAECTDKFFSTGQWNEMRFLWGDEWASPASSNEPPPPPPPPYTMIGGGRCLDPETRFDEVCDLCFETATGRITAIAPWSRMPAAATPATTCGVPEDMISVVPVRGLAVSPGFITVGSLGGISFAHGRDAVMAGVTALVEAIPGATNVSDWYAHPSRTGDAHGEGGTHPHHFGVAVAATDRAGGSNSADAIEQRLRRGLAEGALAIALDASATGPAPLSSATAAAAGGGVPGDAAHGLLAQAGALDIELLSRAAVARCYSVAGSTGASVLARGRRSGDLSSEEQRLASAQEIVANVAGSGVVTLCLDTGCYPPARNLSALIEADDANSDGAHLMGEGELRAKSLLELREYIRHPHDNLPGTQVERDALPGRRVGEPRELQRQLECLSCIAYVFRELRCRAWGRGRACGGRARLRGPAAEGGGAVAAD